MTTSKTPRTDAVANGNNYRDNEEQFYAMDGLARQLEHDNARLREALELATDCGFSNAVQAGMSDAEVKAEPWYLKARAALAKED